MATYAVKISGVGGGGGMLREDVQAMIDTSIGNISLSDLGVDVLTLKGEDTEANIQAKTGANGDTWISSDTGLMYIYTDDGWISIGAPDIDLSTYATSTSVDSKDAAILSAAKAYADTKASNGGITAETDPISMPILEHHMETDASRWQDYYNTKTQVGNIQEQMYGQMMDMSSLQVISTPAESETFNFTNAQCALIMYTFTNTNGQFSTITDNGAVVWSSDGIVEDVPMQGIYTMVGSAGDHTIVLNNMSMIEYLGYVKDPNTPMGGNFQNHITTDKLRWTDTYEFEGEIIDGIIQAKGMMKDTANNVDVINYHNSGQQYTVTNALGGLLTVTFTNSEQDWGGSIYINGVERYNSDGLVYGDTTKYYHLNDGDMIYVFGFVSTATFTPYIADPNSQMQQMLVSINNNTSTISNLQSQILNIQASISNKTINGQTAVDIKTQSQSSYTFSNELGGRLVGQGVRTIGLLGITVLSTGTVSVNGVEVYNNTSLIGVGDAEILNMDINDGDVITSSGMNTLTVTNYVAG